MTDGSKLSAFIRDLLGTIQLTLAQEADMTTCNGGTFEPEDIEIAMIDVQILHAEGNVGELIKLYKKLPLETAQSDALAEYLNLEPTAELAKVTNLADVFTKEYRMNTLYKIINKNHKLVTFTMNNAQKRLFDLQGTYPRIVICKSRQRGISTYALLDALDECITQPNKIRGLQADTLLSSNALMKKVKLAYEKLPLEVKPSIEYSNNSEISFSNGSTLRIATSFRGATLSSLHVSELAKIAKDASKAEELVAGTFLAIPMNMTSSIVLESTAEGAGDMFHSIYTEANTETAGVSKFYPMFIGWLGIVENGKLVPDTADEDCSIPVPVEEIIGEDGVTVYEPIYTAVPAELKKHLMAIQRKFDMQLTDEQIEWSLSVYSTLGLDKFKQEFPATSDDAFAMAKEGKILAEAYQSSTNDLELRIDTRSPLYAASDLGVDDTCATVFFQYIDNRIYVVGEYLNTGQSIYHYTAVMMDRGVDLWALPHDANARDVSTANKVVTAIRQAGFYNYKVLKRTKDLWQNISLLRTMMPFITFGNVEMTTKAMMAYRKVWSPQTGQYLEKPLHDDNSHVADAMRYMVTFVNTHLTSK